MSDTPLIDPENFASPSNASSACERGEKDTNVKIIRTKGKRGGQPGNKNALRHGFYARNLGMYSPSKLNEFELRNLLGEAAMLKDYMYILYHRNLESHDSVVLAETLRALSLAGMALSRLLQVHKDIHLIRSNPNVESSLSQILSEMDVAASRANSITSRLNTPLDDDDDV
jgi:hypothetical protein